jgi:predicted O-methyltransferase YrrM
VSLERVRSVRKRLFESGAGAELFPVAIGPEEGAALRDWVVREGAETTLEAGLAWGVSALFIFEGLLQNTATPRHAAADPFQRRPGPKARTRYDGAGLRLLEEAGVTDLLELYEEESQIAFPRLLAQGRSFDLAFVDASHRFERVFTDLFYAGCLLHERRIVFVDDIQLPAIRKAVQFFVRNLNWRIEDEGEEDVHAWAVVRTGTKDAFQRPFTEFADF